MRIIGRDGPAYLLLIEGAPPDPKARVQILDPVQATLFAEQSLGSALAHVNWIETPHDEDLLGRLLGQVRIRRQRPA